MHSKRSESGASDEKEREGGRERERGKGGEAIDKTRDKLQSI